MISLLIGIATIIVVMAFIVTLKPKSPVAVRGDELAVWPFSPIPLMTDSEILFYQRLCQALPEYTIFCQVGLSRIIEPSVDVGSDRQFWFNRISRQSVDYVVMAADRQTVLVAIELDDWTHDSLTRQKQDAKKDKALSSAGIAIMRFDAEKMPTAQIIRHDVLAVVYEYT